jgi:hypothetical protein
LYSICCCCVFTWITLYQHAYRHAAVRWGGRGEKKVEQIGEKALVI